MPSKIEIAQKARLKPIVEIAKSIGLNEDDIEPYGKYKAKISLEVLKRFKDKPDGRLIIVTSVTPTRTGEGKTTMAIGLAQAFGRLGRRNIVVLRQPSLGPVFGVKGGATGGGLAQVLPMEDINIHFTGDLHAITSAHNLLTSLMENHIYRGNELNINIHEILWKRVMDIECRDLRNIVVGLGGELGGIPHESGFEITTASEIAAIHALSCSLMELKQRMAEITVAYDKNGSPVKAKQLRAEGAMTILMKDALKPNLVQTLENTPAIIHGGPFANIAHGCPSLVAIKMALKLADFVIVEPGFGADLGMEKFCDIAARVGGLKPDLAVIVATVKALKNHGGAKAKELSEPNVEALEKGLPVLEREVSNAREFGLKAVVCMNHFASDSQEEIDAIMGWCRDKGIPVAFVDTVFKGGEGGIELANLILKELESGQSDFRYLYPLDLGVEEKIRIIAKKMYAVSDIELLPEARKSLKKIEKLGLSSLPICMAKTPLSLTDDENIRGIPPEGYILPITNLKPSTGAGFLVAYCGDINTMPALPSKPASDNMDIDEDGRITGLS
ncbi:formate--tetrahydrofolate ligase [Candidatus Bathyarchaeota archaeon]|nr:formate--tetrahydrofolate ligase [Candidatus Bathyarchaeota archaeon]MBS7631582.1 formate--tetrahydrofolate ligase [Candidatus Bathyarchaeota archaeon]